MATYVLVHGAYQGGWIWKPVATRLRAAGHLVYTPTLEGCAERRQGMRAGITIATHAQEIAQFLFYEDLKDVVLVGTSSGGMVISRAAEQAADRIARLVFVDALALMNGEKVGDIVTRPAAPEVTELTIAPTTFRVARTAERRWRFLAADTGVGITVDLDDDGIPLLARAESWPLERDDDH